MLRTTLSSFGARGTINTTPAIRSTFFQTNLSRNSPIRHLSRQTIKPVRASKSSSAAFSFSSKARPSPSRIPNILQRLRNSARLFHKSRARRSGATPAPEPEPTTLGGRLKKLSREYGWSALGVYFALSALDFPFCYLFVKTLGTDRIGRWEETVVSYVKRMIPDSVKQTWHDWRVSLKKTEREVTGSEEVTEHVEMAGWGVEEATERNRKDASLATQLALAYAIHKSFIFIRVPIAVAVTPKVVKVLRGWGWDIGKRTTKEAKALKRASMPPKRPRARFLRKKSG